MTNDNTIKIGIELHLKLKTQLKLFCKCKNDESVLKNTNVCEICRGEPGALPSLNLTALESAKRVVNLLNCKTINDYICHRKHYHYRDIPAGFQRTMYIPLGQNGQITVYDTYTPKTRVQITKVLLEEDPCKTIKNELDYNRSGTPLVEIVSGPTFSEWPTVIAYIKTLINMFDYAKVIDKHNKNVFRADVNISNSTCARVELKNLGSFLEIEKAITAEIRRQKGLYSNRLQTREYSFLQDTTVFLRSKESQQQYHYLVDFNIPKIDCKQYQFSENSVYYYFQRYLQLNLAAPRAWAFAIRPQINNWLYNIDTQKYSISKMKLIFRCLELVIKYKKDLVEFQNLLLTVNTESEFLEHIGGHATHKKSLTVVYQELVKSDPQFKYCIQHFTTKTESYILGKLIKVSGQQYPIVKQFIDELDINRC